MLEVTHAAAEVINRTVRRNDLPDGAGIRIAPRNLGPQEPSGFAARLVPEPEGEDEVVEVRGARIFLDPAVTAEFEDKILDANEQPDGRITLGIHQQ